MSHETHSFSEMTLGNVAFIMSHFIHYILEMNSTYHLCTFKEPNSNTETPWHSDESYWLDLPDKRALSFWFPMQDVDVSTDDKMRKLLCSGNRYYPLGTFLLIVKNQIAFHFNVRIM